MSEMFSRRVFMRGLGVVAAAAALTACSSTNEAVNQALIEGAVGGIVAADCKIGRSRYWAANATVPVNEISFRIVMTNVSSKPVTLSGDNFATTLDGTPIPRSTSAHGMWEMQTSGAPMTVSPSDPARSAVLPWRMKSASRPMTAGTVPAALSPLVLPAAISA